MEVLTWLSFLMLFVLETYSFTGFVKEPSNDMLPEGDLAYFTCIVRNIIGTEYVSWLHDSRKMSRNGVITDISYNKRYSIEFDLVFGIYNLRVINIQRKDEGEYLCAVYNNNDQVVAKSRTANFTVLQIPKEHYPICSAILSSYAIGRSIALSCTSEKTNPLARLTWKQNNVEVQSQFVKETISNSQIVSYSFIAKESDNRAMFTCELTTSANLSIRRNCSSGPINIVYAPRVRIEKTSDIIVGKEAIFICYSDANPPVDAYEWSLEPSPDKNIYSLENRRILRIVTIRDNLNGTKVICKVTNSIGSGSNSVNINIRDPGTITKPKNKKTEKKENAKDARTNNNHQTLRTPSPTKNESKTQISIILVVAIGVTCIVVILVIALIPVGYMKYTRRQPSDTISRGRPVSIPDVYFEPRDHVDPMLPQIGLSAPWMRTVGVQVPGECEYDETYITQVMPQSRQVYYSQRMYPRPSL